MSNITFLDISAKDPEARFAPRGIVGNSVEDIALFRNTHRNGSVFPSTKSKHRIYGLKLATGNFTTITVSKGLSRKQAEMFRDHWIEQGTVNLGSLLNLMSIGELKQSFGRCEITYEKTLKQCRLGITDQDGNYFGLISTTPTEEIVNIFRIGNEKRYFSLYDFPLPHIFSVSYVSRFVFGVNHSSMIIVCNTNPNKYIKYVTLELRSSKTKNKPPNVTMFPTNMRSAFRAVLDMAGDFEKKKPRDDD
jgi:hypothetical protein